jgi:uncharacterized membrane protein
MRTHRLAGKLFAISGLLMIIKGFVLPNNYAFQQISGVIAFGILLYPLLHSFLLYNKLGSEKN